MRDVRQRRIALLGAAVALAALVAVWPAGTARAKDDDAVVLDGGIKGKKGFYPIALPVPVDSDEKIAKLVAEVQSFDLAIESRFKVLDPKSFLADLGKEGLGIEPQKWKDVGAFGVIKARAVVSGSNVTLTFKLYEVSEGTKALLEREYTGNVADARKLTHKWCNEVVKYFTGDEGFFGSQITFVARKNSGKKKGSSIMVMDFDGHGAYGVTKNDSVNILPAFSKNGGVIGFTSYMRGTGDLYTVGVGGGRPKRIAKYDGMNTGASFSPDGSKVAVTLSKDGNPEIYVLSAKDGSVVKRLTSNRYIDTSPAWSHDGKEIAFVSNREGSPQIFVMGVDGSNVKRVSSTGNFNQTPSWNPAKGARQLAYTIRDDSSGRADVVTLDLATGKTVRVTQGQGDNEEPTWAPNGRVLAWSSVRSGGSGIYVGNADGTGAQLLVYKGSTTSPDWGPAP